jgi:hypothetical protein
MFLLMVGGFSTYMTLTGRRALQWRKEKYPRMKAADYLFLALGVLTLLIPAAYFTWVGWHHIYGVAVVFAVFGTIMITMVLNDFMGRKRLGERSKSWFLHLHIGRMMGAFIATSTAFLLTNWTSDPIFIAWLLPTALLSPVIFYFQWKFREKPKQILKTAN